MKKTMPFVLVLILAVSAVVFSVSPRKPQVAQSPPAEIKATPAPVVVVPPPAPVLPPAKVTPQPWPQASSDIAVDAAATYGSLENGMRYIIYPNSDPKKRVSLRLHISAGSLMEAEDQQGLAHFLEHMVFNGTKAYSAEELIPKMQRLGIAFGAHVNAYTSFDETVYMLDLPDLSEETMKLGFTVMRNFGDGALLTAEEIDKERGVILSEKVSRDSVGYRLMEQQFTQLLPGSLLAKRFPIGTDEVIKKAPRERFTDFYSRFYIPQRMTFIVVGDIDPKAIQGEIEKNFASMTNPPVPGKNPDLGPIKACEGIEAAVFADKEVAATDVSLILARPAVAELDTAAERGKNLTLEIAHSILNRRFERLAKIEGSAVAGGSVSDSALFNYLELGGMTLTVADDRWQEAVPILEQEFRRAMDHGFTAAELAEAKSNLLNAYEQQVAQKPTRQSEDIAMGLVKSINDRSVNSDPATDLALAKSQLGTVTEVACHDAFKSYWTAGGYHLVLTTKEKPVGAEKTLAAIYEESRGKPVEAPAARVSKPFGYTQFGKPGSVTSRKEVKDLGITQLVLSNQVRINLKPTDFEKDKIDLLARIGSGKLGQPKDMPMLDSFSTAVFEGGGLGKHSNDELQEILAGKNVSSSLGLAEDAFLLSGATTPADLTTQLQLMCASLTDPGYREEALWQFQKAIPMLYQNLNHTPAGAKQAMSAWLHGGDSRFAGAPIEKLSSYTLADAKKWLTPELTGGYLELTLVGDFELEKVLPELLATFGALPTRAAAAPVLAEARKVTFPNAPAAKAFTYDSKIPQGTANIFWKTNGVRGNTQEFRRLNVLADIYGDRVREEIREKLGASYSPVVGASGSDALDDFGFIIAQSVGKPEDLELLLKTMRELAEKFAKQGATADELDRALKPTLSQLDKSLRENSYWLTSVMCQSQSDPKRLDLARSRDADYRAITLSEINALAKKYLGGERALLVTIKPSN